MGEYRDRKTGEVILGRQIKQLHRGTSFSTVVDTFNELGYDRIWPADPPLPSGIFKTVEISAPVQDAKGNWVEGYIEQDMFSDTVDNGVTTTKAEHEAAYLAKLAANEALAEEEALKVSGIEILGVMCSATKADQMGLTAVGLDYSMTTAGGGTFASTRFSFENGNNLVITADNFATVYNAWVPFRRSFFAVGE